MANRKEAQGTRTKGASKVLKANKRAEAEVRNAAYQAKLAEDSPITME